MAGRLSGLGCGRGGLHLVDGVPLLHPEEQVFTAMLDGWSDQQLARNLARSTVESRQQVVRAFARHVEAWPWQWPVPCDIGRGDRREAGEGLAV